VVTVGLRDPPEDWIARTQPWLTPSAGNRRVLTAQSFAQVEAHPNAQRQVVASGYFGGQLARLVLDYERRKISARNVILQCRRGTE
jgi:hypothetical protein